MKQRLIGAIVLGCLAIIFIPILLDGEGVTPAKMNTTTPVRPALPPIPTIQPVRPVILSDTDALNIEVDDAPAPIIELVDEDEKSETPPIVEVVNGERPRLNVQGIPDSWSVRLASFGEKANAEGLIKRLLADDHPAYSRPITSSQGPLTAVYVGPVLTEPEAIRLRSDLEAAFSLKGIVVQFTIEELGE